MNGNTLFIQRLKVFCICLPPSFPPNKWKIACLSQMKKKGKFTAITMGEKIIQGQFVLIFKWLESSCQE